MAVRIGDRVPYRCSDLYVTVVEINLGREYGAYPLLDRRETTWIRWRCIRHDDELVTAQARCGIGGSYA